MIQKLPAKWNTRKWKLKTHQKNGNSELNRFDVFPLFFLYHSNSSHHFHSSYIIIIFIILTSLSSTLFPFLNKLSILSINRFRLVLSGFLSFYLLHKLTQLNNISKPWASFSLLILFHPHFFLLTSSENKKISIVFLQFYSFCFSFYQKTTTKPNKRLKKIFIS